MSEIHRAYELGQSFWLDFIRRDFLENGELAALVEADEVRGITSNPSIFKQAIAESDLYLSSMRPLAHAGWSAERIFETLAIDDIKAATDHFLPLYEGTDGRDGFVSIEVNPDYAADTDKTLDEARRLWETINRQNLMVKIPATREGVPAIERSIYEGININVTLIFSLDRYSDVMEAYLKGLERRAEEGLPLERSASVASFFVSRVDSAVDSRLEALIKLEGSAAERAHALLGKAAVANAKLAYAQFKMIFGSERFERLRDLGARVQRPLWASTSTKNPAYSDVLYVDELIGPDTVNTLPPKTLDAFRDHGTAEDKLEVGLSDARAQLEALEALDISLEEITLELERAGVQAFAKAYSSLLETVEEQAVRMRDELGPAGAAFAGNLKQLDDERIAPRFWRIDPELWPETKGGSVTRLRLEWLEANLEVHKNEIKRAIEQVQQVGFERIGWINGGFARDAVAEAADSDGDIAWLETLDPAELRRFSRRTPVDSTLFVVESRSHTAPGVMAASAAVWQRARNRKRDEARSRYTTLAPQGSELNDWSEGQSVLHVAEWNFSSGAAVSAAGMWQAAVLGADPGDIAAGAERMKSLCAPGAYAALNPGLYLGAFLAAVGEAYIVADPPITARAHWLAGYLRARLNYPIWPRMPHHPGAPIIYLRASGDLEPEVVEKGTQGGSVAILESDPTLSGIGEESVRWEIGSAIAAYLRQDSSYAGAPMLPATERLGRMLDRHAKKGTFSLPGPTSDSDGVSIWRTTGSPGEQGASPLEETVELIAGEMEKNGPLFIGLYIAPSRALEAALSEIVNAIPTFGALPEVKIGAGFALLVTCSSEKDFRPETSTASLGEIQLASMIADFEQLKETGSRGCALRFKTEEAMEGFLRSIASHATDRAPVS